MFVCLFVCCCCCCCCFFPRGLPEHSPFARAHRHEAVVEKPGFLSRATVAENSGVPVAAKLFTVGRDASTLTHLVRMSIHWSDHWSVGPFIGPPIPQSRVKWTLFQFSPNKMSAPCRARVPVHHVSLTSSRAKRFIPRWERTTLTSGETLEASVD